MALPQQAAHHEPISWQNAFDLSATEPNALEFPNEAAFYTALPTECTPATEQAGIPNYNHGFAKYLP